MNNTIQLRAQRALKTYRELQLLRRLHNIERKKLYENTANAVNTYRNSGRTTSLNMQIDTRIKNLEQDIETLTQYLNGFLRNYTVSRAIGKLWEDGLRSELAFNRDTKIEYVPSHYRRFEVPKPGKIDFTLLDDVSSVPVHVGTIELELRQWANPVTKERRFLAFSDELNILYVRQSGRE